MKHIWQAQQHSDECRKANTHEPRWMSWWTSTFWWRTQQQYEVHNVYTEFQAKVSGAQDTLHNTIGHLTMAIWAKKTL